MEYRETMRAVQAPDIYDGPNCDRHRPRWSGSAEGDMDGEGPIGPTLKLAAKTFPPGTKVTIEEPVCPECHMVPTRWPRRGWKCECDFDWKSWAEDEFQ